MARLDKRDEHSVSSLDDDEAALRWDGDDVAATEKPAAKKHPAAPGTTEPGVEPASPKPRAGTSSLLLVSYGILGGVYLIYTIGWLVGMHHVAVTGGGALRVVAAAVAQGLALASPALWFLTTLYLTRKRSGLARLLALISGLIVVLPWPFVLLGA